MAADQLPPTFPSGWERPKYSSSEWLPANKGPTSLGPGSIPIPSQQPSPDHQKQTPKYSLI